MDNNIIALIIVQYGLNVYNFRLVTHSSSKLITKQTNKQTKKGKLGLHLSSLGPLPTSLTRIYYPQPRPQGLLAFQYGGDRKARRPWGRGCVKIKMAAIRT